MGGERQGELLVMCHMVGRTVQVAIDNLNRRGLVVERNSLDDARKKGIVVDSVGLTVIC
jgi:beta-lactam-binding protein with PASTA domain